MTDVRPRCRHCGRPWLPAEGVDANASYCRACSAERRRNAIQVAEAKSVEAIRIDGYVVRVPRNTSA